MNREVRPVPRTRERGKLVAGLTVGPELPEDRPVRTCVGCKGRAVKSSLLRLVVVGGEIVPDPSARLPGRGAYVHPDQACLDLAQRRKAFPRALRVPGPLSTEPVTTYLSFPAGQS